MYLYEKYQLCCLKVGTFINWIGISMMHFLYMRQMTLLVVYKRHKTCKLCETHLYIFISIGMHKKIWLDET